MAWSLGVDEKGIREWHIQMPLLHEQAEEAGQSMVKKWCQLQGGSHKPLVPDVEQVIAN